MSARTVITHAPNQGRGVSLGKTTDGAPVARAQVLCANVLRGCAHTAIMDESGAQVACGPVPVRSSWMLRTNDLDSLACWFAVTSGRECPPPRPRRA